VAKDYVMCVAHIMNNSLIQTLEGKQFNKS